MVNITKRMHKLMPRLWRVKGGAGAAILPPKPPRPQLVDVFLQIPNPANGYDHGAHSFWRKFLPALRYHNLTLPIRVEEKAGAGASLAPTLTLRFEATTREALEQQDTQPPINDEESLVKWKTELARKHARQRAVEVAGGPILPTKENSWVAQQRKLQEDVGIPADQRTSVGAITVKPQAAADPAAPSTTSPPTTVYQRSVTLGLRGRYALDIWRWFQGVTGARPYKLNRDERRQVRLHGRFRERAEEDRQRVKAGMDAMRREKEELRKAKEAAERLQLEA